MLLYCDGSKNNIPWLFSLKLAGTYPLPWHGINVSGALQALAGAALGTTPLQYGVFTAGYVERALDRHRRVMMDC